MKIKQYIYNDKKILLYSLDDSFEFPNLDKVGFTYDRDVDEFWDTNSTKPIFEVSQFIKAVNPIVKTRNREKILSENHVESWIDLWSCYNLIRYKTCNLSKNCRDLVLEKFTELNNLIPLPK